MILLRRTGERRHVLLGNRETWHTFSPAEGSGPPAEEFGVLTALDEIWLSLDDISVPALREASESITYLYRGALAQEDSRGGSGVLHAGEFQRMTLGFNVRLRETNASRAARAQLFRIALHPSEASLGCAHEQKRFGTAQRHNRLCVVASPDGRAGSLRILQGAQVCSSVLDPGRHLIHPLDLGRSTWIHVIHGEVRLLDFLLAAGDGVGLSAQPAISLTAQKDAEILLVDLGARSPPPAGRGRGHG